jgi:hypothetical protein
MVEARLRATVDCHDECDTGARAGGTHGQRGNSVGQKRSLQSTVSQATIAGVIRLLEREAELTAVRVFRRKAGEAGRARLVLRARGSDLESDFAFGIARQLAEHHCSGATRNERAALFRGPASVARPLLMRNYPSVANQDISFAVVHGLYWLMVNLAARRAAHLQSQLVAAGLQDAALHRGRLS